MTCVVGVKTDRGVWIGADSQATGGHSKSFRSDPKVFLNGDMVFGYTSSFRMGQILEHSFSPPAMSVGEGMMRYMCTSFIDSVRMALKEGGFAAGDKSPESGGTFLVGFAGDLYEISDDYQVARVVDGYTAIGSGYDNALGALFVTVEMDPEPRIEMAIKAAEKFNTTVGGKITIIKAPDWPQGDE